MEKYVAEQVQQQLKSIALSDDWAEKMLGQIEQWAQDEQKGTAAFA
jgi:hypothetical protein